MDTDCPKCHRPMNMGNSPNAEECTETDDDEGLCEAYAKVWATEVENRILCAFINRELQMIGSDPRIAELKKEIEEAITNRGIKTD